MNTGAAHAAATVVPMPRLSDSMGEGTIVRWLVANGLAGGTFTISNLGMFGISWFQPIVNPPQAAILGVGGIASRGGEPTIGLTLVSDHRIVYGAHAARFLADLRELLENPLPLVAAR